MSGSEGSGAEDDTWDDWEEDAESRQPVKLLFSRTGTVATVEEALARAAAAGFDLSQFRQKHQLDYFGFVRLVNLVRVKAEAAFAARTAPGPDTLTSDEVAAVVAAANDTAAWIGDEQYLRPRVDGDRILQEAMSDSDSDDEIDGYEGAAVGAHAAVPQVTPEASAASGADAAAASSAGGAGAGVGAGAGAGSGAQTAALAAARATIARLEAQLAEAQRLVGRLTVREAEAASAAEAAGVAAAGEEDVGRVARGEAAPTGEANDGYYFDSYSSLTIHEQMLKDRVRTEAYRDAILRNSALFAGKAVLDVGCGTSILSMFAARAGAAKVIGVDNSGMIDHAANIVAANGLSDAITLIQGKMENVKMPVDKVDFIISEWMGYALLYESMLDSVLDARDKYLRAGGYMLPDVARVFLEAVDDKDLWDDKLTYWHDVYGFDMTSVKHLNLIEPVVDVVAPDTVFSDCCEVKTFNLNLVSAADLNFEEAFTLTTTRDGACHGIVLSFDTDFFAVKPFPGARNPSVAAVQAASPVARRAEAKEFLRTMSGRALDIAAAGDSADGEAAASAQSPRDEAIRRARRAEASTFLRTLSGRALVAAAADDASAPAPAAASPPAAPAAGAAAAAPEQVTLSTKPSETPTHWKQTVLLLKDPIECSAGTRISGYLRMMRGEDNHREQVLRLKVTSPVVFTQEYHLA